MEFRYLGNSGLRVSQICLGKMDFGATMSDATARKVVDTARVNQVNFIDTADAYSNGASEKIVGKLIKKDWAAWVLATKVGQQDGPPERKCGLSRSWMMEAIDGGLARLGTDYVDIYYMHHRDRDTPIGESVAAMGDIIASGKAFYWGGLQPLWLGSGRDYSPVRSTRRAASRRQPVDVQSGNANAGKRSPVGLRIF